MSLDGEIYPQNVLVKFFLILIFIWIRHFFIFILIIVACVVLVEVLNIMKEIKLENTYRIILDKFVTNLDYRWQIWVDLCGAPKHESFEGL
jgi:hypothetical protein